MIFIDSWVWLEFFQDDEKSEGAEEVIQGIKDQGAVISTTVLMEVRYRVKRKYGVSQADKITGLIKSLDELKIMPVTEEVAVYASDIRDKYYSRSENQVSYADSVHIATAAMTECDALFTGDPDFEGVDEVKVEVI